ncbi:hypothetical protein GCM10010376_75240 [Streptomyces violaceusniger]
MVGAAWAAGAASAAPPRARARVAVAAMVRYLRIGNWPFVWSVPIGPAEKARFIHRVPAIGDVVFPIAPVDREGRQAVAPVIP